MTTVIGATRAATVLLSCVEHAVCCHKSALQLPSNLVRDIRCWARLMAGSHSEPHALSESSLGVIC